MAHAVETMAYNKAETPWHGLGVPVAADLSADEMLVAAGLDWEVTKLPLFYGHNKRDAHKVVDHKGNPDRFALVRATDERFYDIVGKNYKPTQNRDAFKLFKDFVEAGDATMETAGSLHDGQKVWGLAKLGTDFKLAGGDVMRQHLLLMSPHKHGSSLIAKLVDERVVCANTLAIAMGERSGEYRMPHVIHFDESAIDKAKQVLGLAREDSLLFQKAAKALTKCKLPVELQIEHLAKVFAPKQEEFTVDAMNLESTGRVMKKLYSFLNTAPGADLTSAKGTAWGAVNAATYFTSHVYGNDPSNRLDSAWTGDNSKKISRLIGNLLEQAGSDLTVAA